MDETNIKAEIILNLGIAGSSEDKVERIHSLMMDRIKEAQKELLKDLFEKNKEYDTRDFKGFYMLCFNKLQELEEVQD